MDVANIPIRHVMTDKDGVYVGNIKSELDDRFTLRANIDQSGWWLVFDSVYTMLNEGHVVMVPTETTVNPFLRTDSYDILSIRAGYVVNSGWSPHKVRVSVYNEDTGQRVEKTIPKDFAAVVINPLFPIMNDSNSTLQRYIQKLSLLDVADNQLASPNIDLILQLPMSVRTEDRKKMADQRIKILEEQLRESKYGVAYVDSTEKITQLNRPVTNVLTEHVKYLKESLYAELGMSPGVFSGTASPEELAAYYSRTIGPIIQAITDGATTAFLTRTAISRGQRIMAVPDLFKMASLTAAAEAAETFTRNEIMTGNEVRAKLGLPKAKDKTADELRNKNLNVPADAEPQIEQPEDVPEGDAMPNE